MSSPIGMQNSNQLRESAPFTFAVKPRLLVAPTVPQAVNGQITAPANGATLVVPREVNLSYGERVRGVMGVFTSDPIDVLNPGAELSIPVTAFQLWGLNLEGAQTWFYEVFIKGKWVPSASVSITVAATVPLTDDFQTLGTTPRTLPTITDRPPFVLRVDNGACNCGNSYSNFPPLKDVALYCLPGSALSFLLKQSCRGIQFDFACDDQAWRNVYFYSDYEGTNPFATVRTQPIIGTKRSATFTYRSQGPLIRRVLFQNAWYNTMIDNVVLTP